MTGIEAGAGPAVGAEVESTAGSQARTRARTPARRGAAGRRPPGPVGVGRSLRAVRGLLSEPCGALDELSAAYGRTFEIRTGPLRLLVVGDAHLVGGVLSGRQERFRWRTAFRNLMVVTGPTAMMVSDGDDHRRRRRLAQPAFARRRLDAWAPLIVREADRAIDALPLDIEVDLHPVLRGALRRIVVRILFGEELAERADEIGTALEPAITYAGRPFLRQLPHPFPVGARQVARRARAEVDRLLDAEIARRRAAPPTDRGDVLDALLAQAEADGTSDAEIRDQVVTLIAAGHDTTSASISWLLARALTTPGVIERLREEATTVLPEPAALAADGNAPVRLDHLPFADAVGRETLRLHPAGPIVPRYVAEGHEMGPYQVRARSLLLWSPYLLGRDPAHWDEATTFRPERFLDGDGAAGRDAVVDLAYAPFGAGPRKCIGFALAQLELQLIASRVAQRLRLAPRFAGVPRPVGMVTSRPEGGVPVTVHARH